MAAGKNYNTLNLLGQIMLLFFIFFIKSYLKNYLLLLGILDVFSHHHVIYCLREGNL